jgi:hypothetical protein
VTVYGVFFIHEERPGYEHHLLCSLYESKAHAEAVARESNLLSHAPLYPYIVQAWEVKSPW